MVLFPWASLHAPGRLSVGELERTPFCDLLLAVHASLQAPPFRRAGGFKAATSLTSIPRAGCCGNSEESQPPPQAPHQMPLGGC